MRRRIADLLLFLREFVRSYHTTGAILPSGRGLSRALTRYLREGDGPRRVLEVGPGTGPVTRRIVPLLGPEDRLDLVELNGAFVAQLQRRFATEPAFQAVAPRMRLFQCPVQEFKGESPYDVVISGLPLNNFQPAEVREILDVLGRLLKPEGVLSFFEYVAIRRLKALVSSRAGRARLRGIAGVLDSVLDGHEIRRDVAWLNVPPAWVHHVRLGSNAGGRWDAPSGE